MKVLNPDPRIPDDALVNMLKAHMQGRDKQDFNEIRASLPPFAKLLDGEIHQVAIDAEFDVQPD